MFKRNCPDCGKELTYKWNCELRVATEKNSCCKSCRTIRANKSPNRKNSLSCNPYWHGHEEIPRAWFSKYFLKKGRKKQREGSITMEDVWNLYIKQDKKCALTGIPISFEKTNKGYSASIDRIDSSIEYHLENVQLVHKDINLMKNHFNEDYFIDMCVKVANTRRKI